MMTKTATFTSRTSWAIKMERPAKPELVAMPASWIGRYGKGPLLIATPRIIEQEIKKVRKGKVITIVELRERLARDYHAAATCPLTTGIFLRIIAEHAEEQRAAGAVRITPYWRVVKADGSLNDKYPGGIKAHADRLRGEGIELKVVRGKPKVDDVERLLQKFS